MARARIDTTRPDEGGYALIEVLVSALIVVLMSAAIIQTITATGRASTEQRHRSQAFSLAQEDQARLRSLQISTLQQGLEPRTVTVGNTPYTVTSRASFISDKTGTTRCGGEGRADYVQIGSSVSWPTQRAGALPITIESIVSPISGSVEASSGGLAITVKNGSGTSVSGVGLSGSGPSAFKGSTNSEGCAVFGGLPTGEYTVTPSLAAGWIQPSGEAPQPFTTPISGGSTYVTERQYDLAGKAVVTFSVRNRAGTIEKTAATSGNKADSVLFTNPGLPSARTWGEPGENAKQTIEATSVFPFKSAYNAYAGSCTPAITELAPESKAQTSVTITSGGTTAATVNLPVLYLTVFKSTGNTAEKTAVAGATVYLKDLNCKNAEGQLVMRKYLTTAAGGLGEVTKSTVEVPGVPTGQYKICALNASTNRYVSTTRIVKAVEPTAGEIAAMPKLDLASAAETSC